MDTDQAQLWRRIREFPLDDPSANYTFAQRLAREQGRPLMRSRRVVEE
jgi:hypothetical protein